jgi:capping protein alpha
MVDRRAALAAPLLLQSPPGQVANVYEDLVGLVASEGDSARADEDDFKKLAAKVREEHNLQQHIIVDLPDAKGKSVLCASAAHPSGSGRFFAPRQQVSFHVDHETLVSIVIKPVPTKS